MAKYIRLNPYQEIQAAIDAFFTTHYPAIEALALREEPTFKGKIREMNVAKVIKNANGFIIGLVNIHVMNKKYDMKNLKTNTRSPRFTHEQNVDVSPEYFTSDFIDPADGLDVRITVKQHLIDNLALSPVSFSTIYKVRVGEDDHIARAIKTKEQIGYMWEDSGVVLAARDFFNNAGPVLETWVPGVSDITGQTLLVQ